VHYSRCSYSSWCWFSVSLATVAFFGRFRPWRSKLFMNVVSSLLYERCIVAPVWTLYRRSCMNVVSSLLCNKLHLDSQRGRYFAPQTFSCHSAKKIPAVVNFSCRSTVVCGWFEANEPQKRGPLKPVEHLNIGWNPRTWLHAALNDHPPWKETPHPTSMLRPRNFMKINCYEYFFSEIADPF